MAHPSEGTLQAYLDHALSAEDRVGVAAHLEHCPACRAELELLARAAAVASAALALLDAPADLASARAAVTSRATATEAERAREPVRIGPAVPELRRAFLRAAVLILATAAVAAAAIPGSPLHRWLVRAWHEVVAPQGPETVPALPPPAVRVPAEPEAAAPSPTAGVSVLPVGDRVRIVFDRLAPETVVQVVLVDAREATVEASGQAASARFDTGPGRIEMIGGGAGEVQVKVPRAVGRASVESNGKLLLFKEDARIRVFSPADTVGSVLRFHPAQ